MSTPGMDWERTARLFPRPAGARPARSVTYQWGSDVYQAVIGHRRMRWASAVGPATATGGRRRTSGNTVISIVATTTAIEIWSKDPSLGWPNPSLLAHDNVLSIDFLDSPGVIAGPALSRRGAVRTRALGAPAR